MKNLLLATFVLLSTTIFAQETPKAIKHKLFNIDSNTRICGYISWGVSVTNSSNFFQSSYSGLEGGITYGDFGAGLIFGRGSLQGIADKHDNINQYFYEAKTFYSKSYKKLTGTVLFGYGGYINTKHNFIEYGAGISYTVKHMGYGITVSNWDGTTYLTPSLTYNF